MIDEFLKGRYQAEQPILLAFSGGPDSLALLHLLIEFSKKHPLKLAMAHVDHGWRTESASEAQEIEKMAGALGLPFHLKQIKPGNLQGNLEAACREERLHFFSSLCQDFGYQAVVLGHHADDVAETVLKRALEGATLPYLSGMRSEGIINGMKVWRPLLSISKLAILEWLHERGLQGFDDKTNRDTKFLRARFRSQVIPYLSETFGKNVSSGLCHISEEAGELRDYLDGRIRNYLDRIVIGKRGAFLDLGADSPDTLFELKYLIRQFCKQCSFAISRECIAEAVQFVFKKTANKSFVIGKGKSSQTLYIDRGRLFIPLQEFSSLPQVSVDIERETPIRFGDWQVGEGRVDAEEFGPTDWKAIWKYGRGEVVLPRGHYELAYPNSALMKHWADHKIPAFFRDRVPVILENGLLRHEFLTGKKEFIKKKIDYDLIKLTLEQVSG